MAEIKSTLDLIMERTRGMSMSPEERESIRQEEMLKKAKGYRLKLLDNPGTAADVLSSLNQEIPEDRNLIQSLLWKLLVEELSPREDLPKYLDILETMEPGKSHILKQIRAAFKSSAKDRGSDKKRIIQKERKRLAALGISGAAVVPRITEDMFDEGDLSPVLEEFKAELLGVAPA